MQIARTLLAILCLVIGGTAAVLAEETDQFTLPPRELADIGPAASRNLHAVLETIIAETNADIRRFSRKADTNRFAASQLAKRRRGEYLADAVYRRTGPGFPRWMRWNRLPASSYPKFYREVRPWKTVYWLAFSQSPFSLVGLSPTVHMYDYYFGTDKLGHFFMQGHTYFTIYNFLREHGKTVEQAHDAIVAYGQILEQSYLGTLVNGVYSNGDLSANYAGWKFYTNLAKPVKIGDKTLPPILVMKNNQWEFSEHIQPDTLLKPYLSDNLSEALNPCRFTFSRSQIRRMVRERCTDWKERRGLTPELVSAKLRENRLWHGERYGHWLPQNQTVSLNTCFGGQ